MAAPLKDSLDYFPLDCNFFEDKTIKGLRVRFGNDGIIAYLYLLCVIYRDNGYYVEYDEDLILDVADSTHTSEETAKKIIEYLVGHALFDTAIANNENVLTSKSIQSRFQRGKKRTGERRKVGVKSQYWLLAEDETEKWISVNADLYSESDDCFVNIEKQSSVIDETVSTKTAKVKDSIVKKSKVKEKIPKKNYADAVSLTDDEYAKLTEKHSKLFVDKCIEVLNNYKLSKGTTYKSDYHAILNWVVERVTKDHPNLAKQDPAPTGSFFDSNPWSDING